MTNKELKEAIKRGLKTIRDLAKERRK